MRQLEFLREGDTLLVTRTTALPGLCATCRTSSTTFDNAALPSRRPSDTSTAAGIARARAKGAYASKGRPASIDAARVREMKAPGMGGTEVAKALGNHRASVYRLLEGGRA